MPGESTNHDAWLALQYVLDELGEMERAAVEQRLADDSALCQAVADAAILLDGTRAAMSSRPMRAPTAAPRRRLSAVIAVAVAALCLVISVLPREERRHRKIDSAARLVSFWRGHAGEGLATSEEAESADDHLEWSNDQVPGWMIAAVSLEPRKSASGQPSDEKWEEN